MEEVKKELYELSKEIDTVYILELVKRTPNDSELGSEIRNYVRSREKDETKVIG